ncbi:MAG: 4-hydroxy-3-methylbut-2-enyl diphosphate reductase [Treponema sp.]|jgi:4-hydroxy-3-methylbut-2-enyl diphosphate reductase|nr:4-hydroxy-3-methylbut-2-enyl diphosphate reductase [Treponema sp.]
MIVLRAKVLGFCMGVRRAVKIASNQLESPPLSTPLQKVYTLGPLIHNPQVLEDLKRRGVTILDEACLNPQSQLSTLNSLSGTVVIIRAHGVSPHTEAELRRRGAAVVDATCPKVKASQLKAASLAKQGYRLFLAGEESHAEIAGIRGYAEDGWLHRDNADHSGQFLQVVSCAAEAEKSAARLAAEDAALYTHSAHSGLSAKTALLAQTTISAEEYQAIGEAVSRHVPELEIVRTICAATRERQDSLRELLGKTDAVVIAGGKASANTRRLLAIAQEAGKPCAIAETAGDIPPDFFRLETIGLAAGASTPDLVIDAIEKALISGM